MIELADIFRRYGEVYLEKHGDQLLPSQVRAIHDILLCRTDYFGGHVFRCDRQECRHYQYSYHSCRNRHCPKCHGDQQELWLQDRRTDLLPVTYFHVVFTVPREIHAVVRLHQAKVYGILMREAGAALKKLALDPKFIGGEIGCIAVLHTWTRALLYYPHVHILVPGGGLSPDGKHWLPCRGEYLVPVKALAKIFRAKIRDALERSDLLNQILTKAWKIRWVVYSKPAMQGPESVLQYFGRYVHRIAMVNSRILTIEEGLVRFRYKDRKKGWQIKTLAAEKFISRFLQHVLPMRFPKVRYYGFLSPASKKKLEIIKMILGVKSDEENDEASELTSSEPIDSKSESSQECENRLCPRCRIGHMRLVATIRYSKSLIPLQFASNPRAPP